MLNVPSPSFCLWHSVHEVSPGRIAFCSLVAVWPQFNMHVIFFLHLFRVSTFTLTHVSKGAAFKSYRNWAVGPVLSMESPWTQILRCSTSRLSCISHCWSRGSLVTAEQMPCGPSRLLICVPSSCYFTLDTRTPYFCPEINQMVCQCLSLEISYFSPWDMASGKEIFFYFKIVEELVPPKLSEDSGLQESKAFPVAAGFPCCSADSFLAAHLFQIVMYVSAVVFGHGSNVENIKIRRKKSYWPELVSQIPLSIIENSFALTSILSLTVLLLIWPTLPWSHNFVFMIWQ